MHVDSSGLKELSGTRSHKQYRKLPPQLGYRLEARVPGLNFNPSSGRVADQEALPYLSSWSLTRRSDQLRNV